MHGMLVVCTRVTNTKTNISIPRRETFRRETAWRQLAGRRRARGPAAAAAGRAVRPPPRVISDCHSIEKEVLNMIGNLE
jgi:hypothetical protein